MWRVHTLSVFPLQQPHCLTYSYQGSQHSGNEGKPHFQNKMGSIFPVRENSGTLGKTQKKSGETREIWDSDPEGKGFRQFRVCASCAMCPSCVH